MGNFLLKNTISFLFVFALLWGCKPETGAIFGEPEVTAAKQPRSTNFEVTSLDVTQERMTITGLELDKATSVKITGPNNFTKTFALQFNSYGKLMAVAGDAISLPLGAALNLIIGNAFGQSTFPITFTLQPNSVAPEDIQVGAVTRLKLNKEPSDSPLHGQILKWDTVNQEFSFSDDIGAGEGGTGTVTQIDLGQGILNPSGEPITSMGAIAVNLGTHFSATPTSNISAKIPYINDQEQMVLDSTSQNTKLYFKAPNDISIYNDGALRFIDEGAPLDIMILNPGGDVSINKDLQVGGTSLTVGGVEVCLQGDPSCSGAGGITEITVTPPITGGGTDPTVNIGLDLNGVVTNITAGTAISVDRPAGSVTVGVVFGSAGNAQEWDQNLQDISAASPINNGFILGDGSNFNVQADPATLRGILGAQAHDDDLDDIALLIPVIGSYIGDDGSSNWTNKAIPGCSGGEVVTGDGIDFICSSTVTQDFFGKTFKTNDEIQFTDPSNNYVALRAPSGASITDYSLGLPPILGANGDILKLDGSGDLYFITPNYQEQTSDFLAKINIDYLVDTSTASVTMSLPASPAVGDWIGFFVSDASNTAIIDGNGHNINGSASPININNNNHVGEFIFNGTEWRDLELGSVAGPAISTINNLVAFGDSTGSLIADTGIPFSSITALQASSTDYELRISTNEVAISALESSGTDYDTRITNNEINIASNDVDITALQASSTDYELRISANQASITNNEANIASNDAEIAALNASSTDYDLRISANQASITNNESNIASNDVEITALQASSTDYNSRISTNEVDIASLQASTSDYALGPAVSTANSVPYYLDTTGKILADSPTLYIDSTNNRVGVNVATPTAYFEVSGNSKITGGLEIDSTTEGFLPPRMSIIQRDAIATPTAGLFVYNTDDKRNNYYDGTAWTDVGLGDVVGPATSTINNIVAFGDGTGSSIIDSGIPFSSITALQASSTDYDLRISTNETNITALQASSTDYNPRITANEVAIAGLEGSSTDFDTRISTNETNIATNATNISVLQASSTDYDLRISANQASITVNEGNIASNDVEIAALNASSTAYNADIAALQASSTDYELRISTNEVAISALESSGTDYDTRITNNETNIASNDVDIAALNASSTDYNSRISTNETNITTNTSEIVTNTTNITALQASSTDYNSRISTNETNITTNTTAITANTNDITVLQASSTDYNLRISANKASITVNEGSIASNDVEIAVLNASSTDYELRISTNEVDIASLQASSTDYAQAILSINAQTGASYNLDANDCGNVVTLNNAGSITLSVPVLTNGCKVDIIQLGAGQVTIGGIDGMDAQNAFNLFNTRAQYSVVTVTIITPTIAVVSGDIN